MSLEIRNQKGEGAGGHSWTPNLRYPLNNWTDEGRNDEGME